MSTASMTAASESKHLRGVVLVLLAGLAWSTAGPLVRAIEAATPWQILFYRSVAMFATVALFAGITLKGKTWAATRALGWYGPLAGGCIATSFICYLVALAHTTVANTLFMLAIAPLLAAWLGRFLLGEAIRRTTWAAIAVALAGIAIMVWDGFASGNLFGNLLAFGMAVGFACFTVVLRLADRHARQAGAAAELQPALLYGAFFGILVSAGVSLASGDGLLLTLPDTGYALALGVVQVGLGLVLYTLGARYLAAAEATLLSLSEVVLGPLWTWLIFSETPSDLGLIGGLVLLSAMVLQAGTGMRRRRPPVGVV